MYHLKWYIKHVPLVKWYIFGVKWYIFQNLGIIRKQLLLLSFLCKNNIFYSIAASLAESVGASWIIGGHHQDDQSQFPDSTPKYFEQLNSLLKTSLASYKESPIKIINPLSAMNKSEVIKLSLELEAPLELTWSCYTNQKQTCGICRSCISRKNAFNNLKMIDPTDI